MVDHVRPALERLRASLPADDTTPDELARVAALSRRITALSREPLPAADALVRDTLRPKKVANEAELLQLIYETPEDDGPRLVYADWLLEAGDPRAELLALQLKPKLTGKDERRVRQLLKAHGRAWLGPLEPAVELRSEVFARGFVSTARVAFRTQAQREALVGHPAWNTLTEVTGLADELEPFLLGTELRGLEVLRWLSDELLARLARRPLPWRRLAEVQVNTRRLDVLADMHAARFPRLTVVELNVWDLTDAELGRYAPDLTAPHLARLEEVRLVGARGPGLLSLFGSFPSVTSLVVTSTMVHRFSREPAVARGRWSSRPRPTTRAGASTCASGTQCAASCPSYAASSSRAWSGACSRAPCGRSWSRCAGGRTSSGCRGGREARRPGGGRAWWVTDAVPTAPEPLGTAHGSQLYSLMTAERGARVSRIVR